MQIVKKKNKRKAISPVLATVILIAITLIAAIAVAGFVFGLFGTFTKSATVVASVVGCSYTSATTTVSCTLNASNTGTSNTALTLSGQISYASATLGATTVSCVSALASGTLNAGATASVTLTCATATAPASGSAFSGSFGTTNGGSVLFSGSFS